MLCFCLFARFCFCGGLWIQRSKTKPSLRGRWRSIRMNPCPQLPCGVTDDKEIFLGSDWGPGGQLRKGPKTSQCASQNEAGAQETRGGPVQQPGGDGVLQKDSVELCQGSYWHHLCAE